MGPVWTEMALNVMRQLRDADVLLSRFQVVFRSETSLNGLIGRAAHIGLLIDEVLARKLALCFSSLLA